MKKIVLLLFMFIIFPFKVNAVSLRSATMLGTNELNQGESTELIVDVNFDGVGEDILVGLFAIEFHLAYDTEAIVIEEVSAENFDTTLMIDNNGKRSIGSVINENKISEECGNNIFCSNFKMKLKVFAKGIGATDICINKIDTLSFDYSKIQTEEDIKKIQESDFIVQENSAGVKKTINIIQTETPTYTPPEPTTSSGMNIGTLPPIPTTTKTTTVKTKSNNNTLKSLSIDNYNIQFDAYKLKYNIDIPKDTNAINVFAEAEDSQAQIKITGADNLSSNNYEVKVLVTAENGDIKEYTISAKTLSSESPIVEPSPDELTQEEKEEIKEDQKIRKKTNRKILIYCAVVLITIILLVIANVIINKIRYKKLEKALNKL